MTSSDWEWHERLNYGRWHAEWEFNCMPLRWLHWRSGQKWWKIWDLFWGGDIRRRIMLSRMRGQREGLGFGREPPWRCLLVRRHLIDGPAHLQIHFAIWDKYILQFETNAFCREPPWWCLLVRHHLIDGPAHLQDRITPKLQHYETEAAHIKNSQEIVATISNTRSSGALWAPTSS